MRKRNRTSTVEALETRQFLSGDVSVLLRHGELIVRGDTEDNQILVSSPTAGVVRVTGMDDTTVKGELFVEIQADLNALKIDVSQGGEDEVSVQGALKIAGDLVTKIDEGELIIEGSAGPVEIGGDLIVRGVPEADVTIRNAVSVAGNMTIRTGGDVSMSAGVALQPDFDAATFSDSLNIDNPYFPLVVGTVATYEAEDVDEETGETVIETIIVEVLDQTRTIQGVEVRVVRDQEIIDGLLIEDTLDFFAQDDNGNVWYFGEETTEFEYDDDGNLIGSSTEGSFEAGVDGARAGVIMMANPTVGDRYFQEMFAGNAMDLGEVLAIGETVSTPIGDYSDVLRTKETNSLEAGGLEHKLFAPGVGMILQQSFDRATGEFENSERLVSLTLNGQDVTQLVPITAPSGPNATGVVSGPIAVAGRTFIRCSGEVVLVETRLAGGMQIFAKSSVIIAESILGDTVAIKAKELVALNDSTFADTVAIRGDVDVYVAGSSIANQMRLHLGLSDNTLTIADSTITDLDAFGWRGEDVFEDLGGNVIDELKLRAFED